MRISSATSILAAHQELIAAWHSLPMDRQQEIVDALSDDGYREIFLSECSDVEARTLAFLAASDTNKDALTDVVKHAKWRDSLNTFISDGGVYPSDIPFYAEALEGAGQLTPSIMSDLLVASKQPKNEAVLSFPSQTHKYLTPELAMEYLPEKPHEAVTLPIPYDKFKEIVDGHLNGMRSNEWTPKEIGPTTSRAIERMLWHPENPNVQRFVSEGGDNSDIVFRSFAVQPHALNAMYAHGDEKLKARIAKGLMDEIQTAIPETTSKSGYERTRALTHVNNCLRVAFNSKIPLSDSFLSQCADVKGTAIDSTIEEFLTDRIDNGQITDDLIDAAVKISKNSHRNVALGSLDANTNLTPAQLERIVHGVDKGDMDIIPNVINSMSREHLDKVLEAMPSDKRRVVASHANHFLIDKLNRLSSLPAEEASDTLRAIHTLTSRSEVPAQKVQQAIAKNFPEIVRNGSEEAVRFLRHMASHGKYRMKPIVAQLHKDGGAQKIQELLMDPKLEELGVQDDVVDIANINVKANGEKSPEVAPIAGSLSKLFEKKVDDLISTEEKNADSKVYHPDALEEALNRTQSLNAFPSSFDRMKSLPPEKLGQLLAKVNVKALADLDSSEAALRYATKEDFENFALKDPRSGAFAVRNVPLRFTPEFAVKMLEHHGKAIHAHVGDALYRLPLPHDLVEKLASDADLSNEPEWVKPLREYMDDDAAYNITNVLASYNHPLLNPDHAQVTGAKTMSAPMHAFLDDKDFNRHSSYNGSVGVALGTARLRKLRDIIEEKSPITRSMHEKEVQKIMPGDWKEHKDNKGMISADSLQRAIDNTPRRLLYNVSHKGFDWGGRGLDQPHEKDIDGKPDWSRSLSHQRHNVEPSKVFQLSMSTDMLNNIKRAGLFQHWRAVSNQIDDNYHSIHPNSKAPIGWIRWTGHPKDGIFIDEIQSDTWSVIRDLVNDRVMPEEAGKKLSTILFGGKHASEAIAEAFNQHLRDHGFFNTQIAIHGLDSKARISLPDYTVQADPNAVETQAHPVTGKPVPVLDEQGNPKPDHLKRKGLSGKPPPVHMRETYDVTPKKALAMEPSIYSSKNMPTQSNPNFQNTRQIWQGKVRKSEEYTRIVTMLNNGETLDEFDAEILRQIMG